MTTMTNRLEKKPNVEMHHRTILKRTNISVVPGVEVVLLNDVVLNSISSVVDMIYNIATSLIFHNDKGIFGLSTTNMVQAQRQRSSIPETGDIAKLDNPQRRAA